MRTQKISISFFLALAVLWSCQLVAQNPYSRDFNMPLSKPNETGTLKVDLHMGGVTVEGYSGKEVLITMISQPDEDGEEDSDRSKEGLKRIPNSSMDFEIAEENNVVYIKGSHKGRTDFKVKVPRQFSLDLSTHHDGEVKVTDVTGEIEVDAHHGGMELINVGGTVVADTHHGDITVSFSSIKSGVPMAFSTYHGDVDITFPGNTNATMKMKSDKGDIYTDFDLTANRPETRLENTGDNPKKIEISSWIYSNIGNGGPEFMFTTHHGDIILRKK
ncbi:MAG: DUF4097 family beta strand repeat-containing protein [Saprospiraceae bacterium]|nr:DUF4097 family beta strand repeat protein [Lewinella sp.]